MKGVVIVEERCLEEKKNVMTRKEWKQSSAIFVSDLAIHFQDSSNWKLKKFLGMGCFDSLTYYIEKLVILVWYLWACKCRIFVLSIEPFVPLFFFLKGEAVLEKSSELIHSGDVIKTSNGSSQDRVMFLFDHQLVYCKKVRTNDSSRPRETLVLRFLN